MRQPGQIPAGVCQEAGARTDSEQPGAAQPPVNWRAHTLFTLGTAWLPVRANTRLETTLLVRRVQRDHYVCDVEVGDRGPFGILAVLESSN